MTSTKTHLKKIVLYLLLLSLTIILYAIIRKEPANQNTFQANMVITTDQTDTVYADIRLERTIPWTDTTEYQYAITDDQFSAIYTTNEPLDWVDDTTAVQVVLTTVSVAYDNKTYQTAVYDTIPMLDDFSSTEMTYHDWEQNLANKAYDWYKHKNEWPWWKAALFGCHLRHKRNQIQKHKLHEPHHTDARHLVSAHTHCVHQRYVY